MFSLQFSLHRLHILFGTMESNYLSLFYRCTWRDMWMCHSGSLLTFSSLILSMAVHRSHFFKPCLFVNSSTLVQVSFTLFRVFDFGDYNIIMSFLPSLSSLRIYPLTLLALFYIHGLFLHWFCFPAKSAQNRGWAWDQPSVLWRTRWWGWI